MRLRNDYAYLHAKLARGACFGSRDPRCVVLLKIAFGDDGAEVGIHANAFAEFVSGAAEQAAAWNNIAIAADNAVKWRRSPLRLRCNARRGSLPILGQNGRLERQ